MTEKISLKDLYGELNYIKGQIDVFTKAAAQVWENEKRIIKLEEKIMQNEKDIAEMRKDIKADNKQNQRILIYIGIASGVLTILVPFLKDAIS